MRFPHSHFTRLIAVAAGTVLALTVGATSFLRVSPVKASANFDPGNLISNSIFTAQDAMTVSDIQAFLVKKNSVLATISPSLLGTEANGRSAAQIIYDATRGSRTDFAHADGYGTSNPLPITLNPEVVLVTLQKESSLITGSYDPNSPDTAGVLQWSMGMGCPDGSSCNAAYGGFTNQVTYGVAQLMRNYLHPDPSAASGGLSGCSFQVGVTCTFANTTGAPYFAAATQQVTFANAATAAFYQYTPHVYNGNYNFWYYTNLWFPADDVNTFSGSARVIMGASSNDVYVATSTLTERWYVRSMDDLKAWGITAPLETLSDALVDAIPKSSGVISKLEKGSGTAVYYFEGGKRYHVGKEELFPYWGISWSDLRTMDDSVLAQIPVGAPLGILTRSEIRPEVYYITGNRRHYVPDENTLYNWGFNWDQIDAIPEGEVDNFQDGGSLGVLIQFEDGPEVYALSGGARLYVSTLDVVNAWGWNLNQVQVIGKENRLTMPEGPHLTRVVKGSGPTVYFIENGQKRHLTSFDKLAAKGASQSDLITVADTLLNTLPAGPDL